MSGFVQHLARGTGSASTTLAVGVVNTMTAGNSIIVVARGSGNILATSCTDNHGNTYSLDKTASGTGPSCAVFSCLNPGTKLSSGDTVTVTYAGSPSAGAFVDEYSPMTAADASGTATGTTVTSFSVSTSGATTQANEVAICGLGFSGSPTPLVINAPFAFRDFSGGSPNDTANSADEVLAATGTPTCSGTNAVASYAACLVTYKLPSSGGGSSGSTPFREQFPSDYGAEFASSF